MSKTSLSFFLVYFPLDMKTPRTREKLSQMEPMPAPIRNLPILMPVTLVPTLIPLTRASMNPPGMYNCFLGLQQPLNYRLQWRVYGRQSQQPSLLKLLVMSMIVNNFSLYLLSFRDGQREKREVLRHPDEPADYFDFGVFPPAAYEERYKELNSQFSILNYRQIS